MCVPDYAKSGGANRKIFYSLRWQRFCSPHFQIHGTTLACIGWLSYNCGLYPHVCTDFLLSVISNKFIIVCLLQKNIVACRACGQTSGPWTVMWVNEAQHCLVNVIKLPVHQGPLCHYVLWDLAAIGSVLLNWWLNVPASTINISLWLGCGIELWRGNDISQTVG